MANANGAEECAKVLDKNDNLPSRQKGIMERLMNIRRNKQKILLTLRGIKENLKEDEEPNKELVAKMIQSYDLLSVQEEEYMKVMQQIVSIRENAAEDVQHEVEEAKKENSEIEGKVRNEGKEESVNNIEGKDVIAKAAEAERNMEGGVDDVQKTVSDAELQEEKDWEEVEAELAKLGSVTGEAVAASIMNEKLLEALQLHRDKRAALEQLRQKETESQRGAAKDALQQVEMARIKVAAEQEHIERKRKTLERLRREALRRGIKIGPGSASEPDILIEPQPEPKSVTEAKLRAKLQAKKRQQNEEEDNSPPVPGNLAPAQRIPPIVAEEIATGEGDANTPVSKKKKGKKGKKARENAKQTRDALNASIREKLAAIEARKKRMRQLQSVLMRPAVPPPAESMDETFRRAQEQLKNLTAMREHLEGLRDTGEQLPEEAAEMIEKQLISEESRVIANQKFVMDHDSRADEDSEIVREVRDEFNRVMSGSGLMKRESDPGASSSLSVGDSQRLINIERELHEQRLLLERIASNQNAHPVHLKAAAAEGAATLRKCLLSADPRLILRLGRMIIDLGNGKVIPELDATLNRLFESENDEFNSRTSSEKDDLHNGTGVEREMPLGHSPSPEGMEPVKVSLLRPDPSAHADPANKAHEKTPEVLKAEVAKRRLSSGRAKLQKQRTLEKVRCITEDAAEEVQKERKQEGNLKGLERDICSIIEGILPWLKDNASSVADEALMNELRNQILKHSIPVCFPDGSASELFVKQLSTIVDDTLAQYNGEKIGNEREQLIFDISEILYNELAFFQLMHDIDNLVDEKGAESLFEVHNGSEFRVGFAAGQRISGGVI